ncbi:MAG: hypothetical protein KGI37_00860 [Alphaproteobacteria bacterium]|nr:hypothetical protein [Alphaproteobacteria bacterium]
MSKKLLFVTLSLLVFAPAAAQACACGCGIFDVGTGTMMPTSSGGTVWLEYDYMDQNRNWAGQGPSNAANNSDKEITTHFITAGGQYMFNRSWGAEIEIPYDLRTFDTTGDDGGPAQFTHSALGDIRVKGIYSGFSDDMSTGVTYGLKLPTGDYSYSGFDRDTGIGTGSTDWLLGGYHMGLLSSAAHLDWFVNGQWDHAFTVSSHYRPGDEWDAALGSYYEAGAMLGADRLAPLLQLLGSYRLHDVGFNADPADSGYRRLLISPGVEYDVHNVKLYADIELPVFQDVNGNQLTASALGKFIVGYSF